LLKVVNKIKNLPKDKLKHLVEIIATYQPDDDTLVVIQENWLSYKSLKNELEEKKSKNERHSEQ